MIETIPGKITLMDLFMDFKAHKHFRMRAGAHKPGFSRKRMNSWKKQQLVDFSMAPRYFGTERSLGMTLHNGYGKRTSVEYELGLYDSVPWRPNCGKGLTLITKETMPNPSLLSGEAYQYTEFLPEVIGHFAYNGNEINVTTETDWDRTGFRYSLGAGFSYDFDPVPLRDLATRTAAEAMIKIRGFNAFGTFFTGFYDIEPGDKSDIALAMTGGVFQMGYKFGAPVELAARYFEVSTSKDFREDAALNAANMVAADQTLEETYKGAGDLEGEHEATFGINFYPFGKNVKIGADASLIWKEFESKDPVKDYRLRGVLQFFM